MQLNKDTLGYLFLTYGKILWVITMKKKTKQVQRIETMEANMNEVNAVLAETIKATKKLKRVMKKYDAVSKYYGSQDWFDDAQAHSAGKLPEDLACGVLSEDLAYNMIGDMYQYALSQLEFVTNFLKKH